MKRINSKYLETGTRWLEDHSLIINDQGLIEKICPQHEADHLPYRYEEELNCQLVVPGCVNAHSHAFQVLLRPSTGQPRHFHDWVERFLYPLVLDLDEQSIYASALLAFSEMLRGGITTVGEFFYVQNFEDGTSSRQRYARAVIEAARETGIRICLIRTLYDQATKPGQRRFQESPEQAIKETRDLATHYQKTPGVSVLPAPHSLHGASRALIEAAAELAREMNTPWHIHLAEQASDLTLSDAQYGLRPLACLADWGVLSDRTRIVHGIWLDDQDIQLMAKARAMLVYNPLTNMALGDGTARIPELLNQGIHIALGTDANLQSDLFVEARMTEYLQRIRHLAMGNLSQIRQLWKMLNKHGGEALGLPVGQLEIGHHADFLIIDPEHPSMLPALWNNPAEIALLNQIIFSMIPQEAIQAVYVNAQAVVTDGKVLNVSRKHLLQALKKRPRPLSS